MPPPTCLPGWNAVNEIVLGALADHLVVFTDEAFGADLRAKLVESRDTTSSFTPDYQAQLIEDECGLEYFRVLQALDADARNHGHDAIASLAVGGSLTAVITTNFDRLIERALEAAGVEHQVFFEPVDLDGLPAVLAQDGRPLPVIKVHGSVEAPGSMVDTMRQRLMGRPEGLERALIDLMAENHVLFAGFSGADLAHDPGYLGLRAAAERNQGFTCLVRPGDDPVHMRALGAEWGQGAELAEAMLPGWFDELLATLGIPPLPEPAEPTPSDGSDAEQPTVAEIRTAAVAEHADRWASSLGHMVSVAIMAELLESSGRSGLAFDLLRRTLRSAAPARDAEAPGYARFNFQLGRRLLELGKFDYEVDWLQGRKVERQNRSGTWTYSPYTANDCYQCLWRSTELLQGHIAFGLYDTYWGRPSDGAERIRFARQQAIDGRQLGPLIDACTALGIVYEIRMQYADGLEWLEIAHRYAVTFGDEPRRARLCAELARFLSMKQRHDEAHERVQEGLVIADRLALDITRLHLLSAQGSVLIEEGRAEEALVVLDESVAGLRSAGWKPSLTRTLIDCCYGRLRTGDLTEMESITDELFDLTEVYPGYRPLIDLMRARFAVWLDREDAATWIDLTKQEGERYQNPGVVEEVTLLEARLGG